MRAVTCALFLLLTLPAAGQELVGVAGVTESEMPRAHSYGWLLSYSHDLNPHLSASLSYQNEGHVPSHHRDGHSAQIWARASAFAPQLSLAAGVGPYRYFDTTVAESPGSFTDAHGWGVMYSLAASWRAGSGPWIYQLRVDRVATRHNLDTTLLMAGVGYRLDQDGSFPGNASTRSFADRGNEVALLGGQTIVNSFKSESENSVAKSIEYRHAFGPVLRGSLGWLNEGDARLIRRNGVLAQLWLEPSFHRDRFTLGLGLGPYIAVDGYRRAKPDTFASAVITATMSYHFVRGWIGRVSWHRISSNYDRDSDIVLLGAGYRF
jgi:hypothetical protein